MTDITCALCGRETADLQWLQHPSLDVLVCSDREACEEYETESDAPPECISCGTDERLRDHECSWCRADRTGRPHGSCPDCLGARDHDGTCACRPPEH